MAKVIVTILIVLGTGCAISFGAISDRAKRLLEKEFPETFKSCQKIIELASRNFKEFGKDGYKEILDEAEKIPVKSDCVSMENDRFLEFIKAEAPKMVPSYADESDVVFETASKAITDKVEGYLMTLYAYRRSGNCRISTEQYAELKKTFPRVVDVGRDFKRQLIAESDEDAEKAAADLVKKLAVVYECAELTKEKDELTAWLKENVPKWTPGLDDDQKYDEILKDALNKLNDYFGKVYADFKSGNCKKHSKKTVK